MPFRRKPKQRKQPARGNFRRRTNPPRRTGRSFSHVHIPSERIFRQTLKVNHNVREIYPLKLSELVDLTNIGADVDVRLVGYNMSVHFASGNKLDTVSCSLSHSGPWVRHGPSDGFNQQFSPKSLKNNKAFFNKRVLPTNERQFLNPHHEFPSSPGATPPIPNTIDLEVIDPCGVIPGVTLVITFKAHFIRPHVPASIFGADDKAIDMYLDQDVNDTSTAPDPNQPKPNPVIKYDQIPSRITDNSDPYTVKQVDDKTVEYTSSVAYFGVYDKFRVTTIKPVQLLGTFNIHGVARDDTKRALIAKGYHPDTVTFLSRLPESSPAPYIKSYRSSSLPRRI